VNLRKPEQKLKETTLMQQKMVNSFTLNPIGILESTFREKFGTPRQSGFVKGVKSRLTLTHEINSESLDGLTEFGHVWIVFIFHKDLEGAGYN
jgi:tRNA (Thr-GGU) A37 N-methylase